MKKLLFLIISLIIFACSTSRYVEGPQSIRAEYINEYFSKSQLDSLIIADTLSNIDLWIKVYLRDYETGEPVDRRLFIKTEKVYSATIKNDSVFITKRIEK